ncbi:protein Shroom2-like isoform X1 [Lytechinus variegatus]|uniref:protein Shroom2-like isoform X1 n=1 Tax=Lytechinus variegatus TaxID=7654 RepID=UPI001BB2B832|nr:protein Shroom2-like isoform X1 [Lytechinus variegatus]
MGLKNLARCLLDFGDVHEVYAHIFCEVPALNVIRRRRNGTLGSSASDFRGPKSPDLRKQAQENAAMMKQTMYPTTTSSATSSSIDPMPKEVAEQKPVNTKRVRKRESQPGSPRPKSWHTDLRALSQPDLSRMPQHSQRPGEHSQPRYRNPPPTQYNQFHSSSDTSFMKSSYEEKIIYHPHGRSTGNLNNNSAEDTIEPLPGHVQKKREAFERTILSQSMDKINTDDYGDGYSKRGFKGKEVITQGVNPNLRNISRDIEPAETYPKVVVATHINSVQSKAVLGRVPESGEQKGQKFGGAHDVNIYAVQMPERQIASSADSSVTRNYAQAHSNLAGHPQTSYVQSAFGANAHSTSYNSYQGEVRKVPPAIPKREDSKTKTQAYSDHVKSSSWPVSTISSETTCTLTVCPTIQPSELPPVKLMKTEKEQKSPSQSASQSNVNQNSNGAMQDIVVAKRIWIDDASEPEFNFEDGKIPSSDNTLNTNVSPPSPPVRDNENGHFKLKQSKTTRSSDDRFNTSDHLIQDYRSFLEKTEQQQENLKSYQPDSSVPDNKNSRELLMRTCDFGKATQQDIVETSPMAQTQPARDSPRISWYQEKKNQERRRQRKRSSLSSDDSLNLSDFDQNRKNLVQNPARTWRNPSDSRDEEWKKSTTSQQQHPVESRISSHSRQSSDLDNPNAPRKRTPISPSLMEETFRMEPEQKTFTEKVERTGIRQESRDSHKSGIFEKNDDNQLEKIQSDSNLSENSILRRLKREGSFKNSVNLDPERSEGNETSARKIIPDTKRDLRNLGLTENVFKQDHRSKGNHYKSGSFTHDSRGYSADPRLMRTTPVPSSHQRTHSIDTYNRNPPRRHESFERRGNAVSRESSFSERNVAEKQGYWEAKSQENDPERDKGEHKKSKSDSDQHPKADKQRKKMSDPINKPQNVRKTSDPENKQLIWDALKGFMDYRRSPPGTSPSSSRPTSMYGSEQSLHRSEIHQSTSSLVSGYSSSRHYPQDSLSSIGSSFSYPLHQPQDSGFGSNSDISQVRSPHSPPQTGVVSPKDVRVAASISRISVSSPGPQYQSSNSGNERRRSHQIQRPHPSKHLTSRMSVDSNLPNYRNQQEMTRSNRSPQEKLDFSPTRQISPLPSYNVHVAERVPISSLKEEEINKEGAIYYESLQPEHTETEANQIFRFPPSKKPDHVSSSGGQRISPKTSPGHPRVSSLTIDPSNQGVDISPPPPPTPLSPLDIKGNMEFPPPPPELAPVSNIKRNSPKQEPSESTGSQGTQEGSIQLTSTERITPTYSDRLQQAPSLEVQVEPTPLAKVEETTPSISPNSIISGRSSPDNHDVEPATSPQHVPRLPSVQENIPFSEHRDSPVPTRPTTLVESPIRRSPAEPEPLDVAEDEEEEEALDVCDSGINIFTREQEKTEKELSEVSDPVLKWVLQALTPSNTILSDLFPLPKSKRSQSIGGTVTMTMDVTTPTKSESETVAEQRSPSECVNLVLSSSRYLRISPAKAIILQRAQTMNKSDDLGNNNTELRKTQEELVDRISKKLIDIKDLQKEVAEEMTNLEDMGRQVMDSVKANCKASEYNKCNMYIADIERVTKLLLSLSRRLSKVESVLGSMENSEEEEKVNLEKLKVTINSQYQDAKMLKESITRRHSTISSMLLNKISNDQHDNFTYYTQMLPRHLIMGQELDDKVKLGEEQLEALSESLKQMSLSSDSENSRDTNGNVHGFKEEAAMSSSSIGIVGSEEINSNATSSYC